MPVYINIGDKDDEYSYPPRDGDIADFLLSPCNDDLGYFRYLILFGALFEALEKMVKKIVKDNRTRHRLSWQGITETWYDIISDPEEEQRRSFLKDVHELASNVRSAFFSLAQEAV